MRTDGVSIGAHRRAVRFPKFRVVTMQPIIVSPSLLLALANYLIKVRAGSGLSLIKYLAPCI